MGLDSIPSRNDEFNDLERHDLLTGEPRYVEDEIRNANFAKIFGILGLLYAIVAMVLTWVLYHRDRNRTFLWHGIITAALILFFIIAIAWAFGASNAVKSGRQPSAIFSGLIFILSLVFIGYLLVESVWLILYRKIHFDYLVGLSTDQNAWENKFPNGFSFTDGWKQDRKMIWWIVFFNLASAVVLGFIAYAARSVSWNRYTLARVTLYLALIIMALAAWLMIFWVEEAYEFRKALPNYFLGNLLGAIKAWAIIALVLAGVNALVNFFQYKVGFFIMALLEIALIIAMVLTVGVILRNVRHAEFNGFFAGGCSTTQFSIHENVLDDRWCSLGGKYLAPGANCRKVDTVNRWEGNNEIRSLNPACCASSNYYYIYPFLLVGFWTLICIYSTAVAVGLNLYIADTNEYLTATNRTKGILDFLGLILVLAMIIAWGIYFLARKANSLDFGPNPNIAAFNDPFNNRIAGFDLVPDAIKVNANTTTQISANDGCIAFNNSGSVYPTFSTTGACTDRNTCVLRLALLFKDATVKFATDGGARAGSTINREQFFPGCTSSSNDYIFYFGTEQQLRTLLDNLRICPRSTGGTTTTFLMYVDQVSNTTLNANGLAPGEPAPTNIVSNVDAPTCGTGYVTASSCVGSCRITSTVAQLTTTTVIKGKLYFLQNGVRNFNIHGGVVIRGFNRNDQIGSTTLYAGGIFVIFNVPRFSSTTYVATVDITDTAGVFLQKKVDVLILPASFGNFETSAGFIRLDTKDGKVCAATDTTCILNQQLQNGNIQGVVRDGTGEFASNASPNLQGASVQLIRWHQVSGQTFGNQTTDSNGAYLFNNLPFDSYSLLVNKTGYRPVLAKLDLQEPNLNVAPIILRPIIDGYDMRVGAVINEPAVDFDVNLLVRSDKGAECTVSPTNKYCAYSAYVNDVAFGAGEEDIIVKKLAVATYMGWLAPSAPYNNNCQAGITANNNAQLYHSQSWNWDEFKLSRSLSSLDIDTFTFGPVSGLNITDVNSLPGVLRVEENVETPAEAAQNKTVLNRDGVPVPGNVQENTSFVNNSTIPNFPPPISIPINGTVSSNTTVNTTVGPCTATISTLQYNNNTVLGFVNVTRTVNSTICPNGTNFTEVTTRSSYFDLDNDRSEILNRTFTTAYSNGSSIVERNNSNVTIPNAAFTLVRSATNNSVITNVTAGAFPTPNLVNNHTYNENILETFNSNSSNLSNVTRSNITELNYNNSSLTQNYSKNFNFVYVPAVNLSGNGTQNTSSFQVYDFGNVSLNEACNLTTLVNTSIRIQCNVFNTTVFPNGTTSTSNGTKDNVVTQDVNAGANLVRLTLSVANVTNTSVVIGNRTESFTKIQLPNGTNSSLAIINDTQNVNNVSTRLLNFDQDINDVNSTNTTVINSSDYKNVTNGTTYLVSLFFNRTTTPNGSNITVRNFSNVTTNGTNQSNSTFVENRFNNVTANGTNQSILVVNSTFNASANFGVANYSITNFTNETDFNIGVANSGTFERFTRNNSNFSYTNGTNSSYFVQTNISNTTNGTNYTLGNLTISFNFSNNSSIYYNHSYNQTVTGNNTSLNNTIANSTVNATITWDNETRLVVNVSGNNESFTNVTFNISQVAPENNTNASIYFFSNYSNNMSQNLSYGNNTTINASWNISYQRNSTNVSTYDESNHTERNYSLNTTNGDNVSWTLLNASNISTWGGNNTTLWVQRNWSSFFPSNDSSVNKTNSSIYNFSNLSSFNNGTVINTTNESASLSIGSNDTNATLIIATEYWRNQSHANGTNFTTFIEVENKTSPANTNWSNISFFNYSNVTVNSPNTTNLSINVSSTNSCLAVSNTTWQTNSCNFTYNFSNGTNDTNASITNNSVAINVTLFPNGSNYSFLFNVSNQSLLNGTAPRINITHFLLNESIVHLNLSNGTNATNFSRFIECFIIQNFTGIYTNCSNASLILFGQNLTSNNVSNISETNVTFVLANQTNISNYTLNLALLNTSNGSIWDNITNFSILTPPITINGTQQNITNISDFSRMFRQERFDFIFAFNESNFSKNVGVSLDNSSHEINGSKIQSNTSFLDGGNISNSTRNVTVVNNWTNGTVDFRYNSSDKLYLNNYTHFYTELYTPNSTLNQSNITRNYGAWNSSSLFNNQSFESFDATNNTGYNLSQIFNANTTYGNITVTVHAPSSDMLNNTSVVRNTTHYVFNASSGDADTFNSSNSTLGIDGINFTYRNFSLNTSQPVNQTNATNISNTVGFSTLNWTVNNLTGTYRNSSNSTSFRDYQLRLFNLSKLVNFSNGSAGLAVNNTYDFFLYDSNNVSGGLNTTLTVVEQLFNTTDNPSVNTTNRFYDLVVCQPNGTCVETFYSNNSLNSNATNASNNSDSRNFTGVFTNNTSNETVSVFNETETITNVSIPLNITQTINYSNLTYGNGSFFEKFNLTDSANENKGNLLTQSFLTQDQINFTSPLNIITNFSTGLNRNFSFNTSVKNVTNTTNNATVSLVYSNLTYDSIELPLGVKSFFRNESNLTLVDGTADVFNVIIQVNRSRFNPNPANGTFLSDYNNSTYTAVFVNNSTAWWRNDTLNLSGFDAGNGSFNGYKFCDVNLTKHHVVYKNNSNVSRVNETSNCTFVNNSVEINTTIKFLEVRNADTATPLLLGNQNFTSTIDGVLVDQNTSVITSARRRRMLMEEPKNSHAQSGSGNFILISCFTGFGTASLININQIVDNQPVMDTCLTRIQNERPDFTVQKLRAAYNDYIARFPGAA